MHRRKSLSLLLAVPLVTLAACGGGGDKSDEDQIRDVVGAVKDDPTSLCSNLASAALKTVDGGEAGCTKELEANPPSKEDLASSEIESVKVSGTTATVVSKTRTGTATASFVKEDGKWKFTGK